MVDAEMALLRVTPAELTWMLIRHIGVLNNFRAFADKLNIPTADQHSINNVILYPNPYDRFILLVRTYLGREGGRKSLIGMCVALRSIHQNQAADDIEDTYPNGILTESANVCNLPPKFNKTVYRYRYVIGLMGLLLITIVILVIYPPLPVERQTLISKQMQTVGNNNSTASNDTTPLGIFPTFVTFPPKLSDVNKSSPENKSSHRTSSTFETASASASSTSAVTISPSSAEQLQKNVTHSVINQVGVNNTEDDCSNNISWQIQSGGTSVRETICQENDSKLALSGSLPDLYNFLSHAIQITALEILASGFYDLNFENKMISSKNNLANLKYLAVNGDIADNQTYDFIHSAIEANNLIKFALIDIYAGMGNYDSINILLNSFPSVTSIEFVGFICFHCKLFSNTELKVSSISVQVLSNPKSKSAYKSIRNLIWSSPKLTHINTNFEFSKDLFLRMFANQNNASENFRHGKHLAFGNFTFDLTSGNGTHHAYGFDMEIISNRFFPNLELLFVNFKGRNCSENVKIAVINVNKNVDNTGKLKELTFTSECQISFTGEQPHTVWNVFRLKGYRNFQIKMSLLRNWHLT